MSVQIITKNSATAGSVPAANALLQGELAVNVKDKKLFSKDADGNVFELSGSGTGGTGTLQQVTDAGNTTTNDIEIGNYDDSKDNTKGVKNFSNGSVRVQRESAAAENVYNIANYSGNTLNWTVRANGTQQIGGNIGAGIDSGSPNITLKSDGSAKFAADITSGGQLFMTQATTNDEARFLKLQLSDATAGGQKYAVINSTKDGVGTQNLRLSAVFTDITNNLTVNNSVFIGGTLPSAPKIELKSNGSAQFSGSVSIGGTATANTIDEYEEGNWTPDVTNTNGDPRAGVVISNAAYRRIGGIVSCSLRVVLDADESTGGFKFSLPFASGAYGCCSIVQTSNLNGDTLNGYISGGTMRCGYPTDHTSGTKDYRGSFTYKIS